MFDYPAQSDANLAHRTPIHMYRMWRPAGGVWVEGQTHLPWEVNTRQA